jgi:hypothetical protein
MPPKPKSPEAEAPAADAPEAEAPAADAPEADAAKAALDETKPAADAAKPALDETKPAADAQAAASAPAKRWQPWPNGVPFRMADDSPGKAQARAQDAMVFLGRFVGQTDGVIGATSGALADVVRLAPRAFQEMKAAHDGQ